jgi:hypothetical protein
MYRGRPALTQGALPRALGLALALGLGLALALTLALAPRTPTPPQTATTAPPGRDTPQASTTRWGRPQQASLNVLRRAITQEADRTQRGLAPCERQSHLTAQSAYRIRYRACAFLPLARTGASAHANGVMLMGLANDSNPAPPCRRFIDALAGTSLVLGQIAQATLRDETSATWAELQAASRAIRGMASDARRAAHARWWSLACRPGSIQSDAPRA